MIAHAGSFAAEASHALILLMIMCESRLYSASAVSSSPAMRATTGAAWRAGGGAERKKSNLDSIFHVHDSSPVENV